MDIDKVRSLQAQLNGGVEEEARETLRGDKKNSGGVKGFLEHQQQWGSESYIQKSLVDAVFPAVEEALEAEGFLQDISEEIQKKENWANGFLQEKFPAGTVVRITAPGFMFDVRYLASIFRAFSSGVSGLQGIGAVDIEGSREQTGSRRGGSQKGSSRKKEEPLRGELEDLVIEFGKSSNPALAGIDPNQLRSLIRVTQGIFSPGLHMSFIPIEGEDCQVRVRLQENRKYLDSEPEILFAQYGIGAQEWTLVGAIGHYPPKEETKMGRPNFMTATQRVRRNKLASFVNRFIAEIGSSGLVDLPQYPSFSVVPFAVYRTVGNKPNMLESLHGEGGK